MRAPLVLPWQPGGECVAQWWGGGRGARCPPPVRSRQPACSAAPASLAMPEKTQVFTEDQVEDFKEVFQLFDTKGDGLIQVGARSHVWAGRGARWAGSCPGLLLRCLARASLTFQITGLLAYNFRATKHIVKKPNTNLVLV